MTKEFLADNIETIARKYNIDFIVYFGSYLTEFYNSDSDIDIGYQSKYPLNAAQKAELLKDLIIFHRKSEIDLVDLRTVEPVLKHEVALNAKILYEREPYLFEKYSLYYIKKYYELKPIIEEEIKNIGNAIKEVLANAR